VAHPASRSSLWRWFRIATLGSTRHSTNGSLGQFPADVAAAASVFALNGNHSDHSRMVVTIDVPTLLPILRMKFTRPDTVLLSDSRTFRKLFTTGVT
jgi:hypothetical protein